MRIYFACVMFIIMFEVGASIMFIDVIDRGLVSFWTIDYMLLFVSVGILEFLMLLASTDDVSAASNVIFEIADKRNVPVRGGAWLTFKRMFKRSPCSSCIITTTCTKPCESFEIYAMN